MKTTMKAETYIELEDKLGAHNYKPLDIILSRGEGIWVWDVDGNRLPGGQDPGAAFKLNLS